MSIGYACLTLGVPGTQLKSCLRKNADEDRLAELIAHNLDALEAMIDYNIRTGIHLFRLSSELIPFGSSPVNHLPWEELFQDRLTAIGQKIRGHHIRVSMHPGQYTVLNSSNGETADRAAEDIDYHVRLLDSLGVDSGHKIILHLGGVYGDKQAAKIRFISQYRALSDSARARIVLENDDMSYHIGDVLEVGNQLGIPVVYDNLHNAIHSCDPSKRDSYWVTECAKTWTERDGPQKIHYSQQDRTKKVGSHSSSININDFLAFYDSLDNKKPDIMLEVKDKNLSAVKCMLCTAPQRDFGALEQEWGRYKYFVLERSQQLYDQCRALLRDKTGYPAVAFYRLIETALAHATGTGGGVNAALHVWGYFKQMATDREKTGFMKLLRDYEAGIRPLVSVKRKLYKLALAYGQDYLLDSYYFIEQLLTTG